MDKRCLLIDRVLQRLVKQTLNALPAFRSHRARSFEHPALLFYNLSKTSIDHTNVVLRVTRLNPAPTINRSIALGECT